MFIAYDKNQERISIENATFNEEYFCPICNSPVKVKAESSKSVKKHFAHKKGAVCLDSWKHDMSEWHYLWQEKFPVDCREIVLQSNGEIHRADVIINKTVFEFQHSPISNEEFTKRNLFYLNCGYDIVWIFDATNKIKNVSEIVNPTDRITPFRAKDFPEINFEWRRRQSVFFGFKSKYPCRSKIAVYLETVNEIKNEKVIIPLKNIDDYNPSAYYLITPLKAENILKEYRIIDDENIESLSQIINSTRLCAEKMQPYLPRPQYAQPINKYNNNHF